MQGHGSCFVCWPLSRSPAGSGARQGPPTTLIWLAEGWTRARVGSTSSRGQRDGTGTSCSHKQEFLGHTGDLQENSPSQAMVGCWVAASSRTHCQPWIPGKAQSNAALLPGFSKGLGNFHLKHKNIFKPRYVQLISREGRCKESRECPVE